MTLLLGAAALCCLTFANQGNARTARGDEQALLQQERAWTEAFKNRDRVALERLLAADFSFTDDEGAVYDKAQYIEAVMQVIKVDAYEIDDLKARVYGAAGVVTGRWTGRLTIDGKDASGAFRFTDPFIKRQGRWQVVASQDTRLPKTGK
jgi:ketosteroid isomerase-like protein